MDSNSLIIDDSAQQHGLAVAGIALNIQRPALFVAAAAWSKTDVVKDLAIRACKQAALGLFDMHLVVPRIGHTRCHRFSTHLRVLSSTFI